MNIIVNANTDDGFVEFMGVRLTLAEAREFIARLKWAAEVVEAHTPTSSPDKAAPTPNKTGRNKTE